MENPLVRIGFLSSVLKIKDEDIKEILQFAKDTRALTKENISRLAQPSIDKKHLLAELFNSIQ